MNLLNASQLKECINFTIKNKPILSINFIEKIAESCCNWILDNINSHSDFLFLCGSGTNGSIGLAVARLLSLHSKKVVVVINDNKKFSKDAAINFNRLSNSISIVSCTDVSKSIVGPSTVIVDSILGIGTNKMISHPWDTMIIELNSLSNQRIALDCPSGLSSDSWVKGRVSLGADHTLCFHYYKRIFFHKESAMVCGAIHSLELEYCSEYERSLTLDSYVIDEGLAREIYQKYKTAYMSKDGGRSMLVGGALEGAGILALAAKSSARIGACVTYVVAPNSAAQVLLGSVHDAVFLSSGEMDIEKIVSSKSAVYGIGPGFGHSENAKQAFEIFLRNHESPIVLGSDAVELLKINFNLVSWISKKSVIIILPKDFDILFGSTPDSFQRLELAKELARKYGLIIIIVDYKLQIVTDTSVVYYAGIDSLYIKKKGFEEVLLGSICGFLSLGYTSVEASVISVWILSKSSELALEYQSHQSLLASDALEYFGRAFKDLEGV